MEKDVTKLGRKINYALFSVNLLVWLVLLFKIKSTPLPVNCSGAWSSETGLYCGFIILLFFAITAIENKYFHMSPMHPVFGVLLMISITILMFCFLNSSIQALCECYNPKIITNTYLQASFALIFDSLAKASIVSGLATEYSKKFREKKRLNR